MTIAVEWLNENNNEAFLYAAAIDEIGKKSINWINKSWKIEKALLNERYLAMHE